MSKTTFNKVKEIFELAVAQPLESRQEFVEKICGSNQEILAEVKSLLEVYEEPDNLIEKNVLNVKSILENPPPEKHKLEKTENTRVSPSELKGDLDNIILKTLRKEPARRYQSVKDLNDDISNYLNGIPVKARPNTFLYRTSKFYSRNKTASIIGLFLILSLIAGIIATTWQSIAARQARDRAEKRFQEVRKLSNSLLFNIAPKIERLPGSTEARQELVNQALEYLDSLSNESQDDLSLQSELASAYEKVGDVQGNPQKANLGDLEGGRESLEKANKIRLALVEKQPGDTTTQRLLAANFNLLGDFSWSSGDIEGSLQHYQKAIEIYEKIVAQNPAGLEINLELYNVILSKIKVISHNGNYAESIKQYRELIQKIEELEQNFPKNKEFERIKADSLMRTANDLSWQDRYDLLDDYINKSFAIYEPLIEANPNDARLRRDLFIAYFYAGAIYVEVNPPRSKEYLEKSVEIARETVENDKLNYLAKYDLARSYSKLGENSAKQKKPDQAIKYLSQAEKILIELVEAEPKNDDYKYTLANNYVRLAGALEEKGDFQTSIEKTRKAMLQHQGLFESDPKNVMSIRALATSNQDLGRVYESMKKPDQSLVFYQQSVEWFILLREKGGLGDYDQKNFETSQKAVERLQNKIL